MQSTSMRIVIGVVGVIGIIAGIAKFSGGINKLFGNQYAKFNDLVEQANAAAKSAVAITLETTPKIGKLGEEIDRLGFPAGREEVTPAAKEIIEKMTASAAKFRESSKLFDQAAAEDAPAKKKEEMALRSKAAEQFAVADDARRELAQAVLDPGVTTLEALLAKFAEASAKTQKANAEGDALTDRAAELAKQYENE